MMNSGDVNFSYVSCALEFGCVQLKRTECNTHCLSMVIHHQLTVRLRHGVVSSNSLAARQRFAEQHRILQLSALNPNQRGNVGEEDLRVG